MGYYIPDDRVYNEYFAGIHGLSEDWYVKRTGISSRSRAKDEESINYMSVEAVRKASFGLNFDIKETDLIIFASYTPSDTVATTAHVIQREFQIENARAFYISSACSSGMNGLEIIKSFFKDGISSKALLVCADRNSTYLVEDDQQAAHLWGDGAVALFFSAESGDLEGAELIDVFTQALGHIGHGPEAVFLNPKIPGIQMPYGKDVFTQACNYMSSLTEQILEKNNYTLDNLAYFIGHQANKRIITHVCDMLQISEEKSLTNIEEFGNTGCGSAFLVFAQNYEKFKPGDIICISVFGGGYSTGACLFKIR